MAGYQVRDTCYSDLPTALDAYAAEVTGQLYNSNTNVWVVTASRSSATQVTLNGTKVNGSGSNWSFVTTPSLPACGKLDTADTIALSWLVVIVWAAAAALIALRRAI